MWQSGRHMRESGYGVWWYTSKIRNTREVLAPWLVAGILKGHMLSFRLSVGALMIANICNVESRPISGVNVVTQPA